MPEVMTGVNDVRADAARLGRNLDAMAALPDRTKLIIERMCGALESRIGDRFTVSGQFGVVFSVSSADGDKYWYSDTSELEEPRTDLLEAEPLYLLSASEGGAVFGPELDSTIAFRVQLADLDIHDAPDATVHAE